jgi:tetratricopeptide (TPR) repeat protein
MIKPKKQRMAMYITLTVVGVVLLTAGIVLFTPLRQRLEWRADAGLTYLRHVVQPVGEMPTPIVAVEPLETATSQSTPTATLPSPTEVVATQTPQPTLTPTELPQQSNIPSPPFEGQDWNNCGPATLAMYLRFYGWDGKQTDISDNLKPIKADRNVNVEDLAQYVRANAGWLNAEYRVGGNLSLLRTLIANGIPVMIESSYILPEGSLGVMGPQDDRWTGHYLLVNGYDDATETFITQNSFVSPDWKVSYSQLDGDWQSFNRVYILIFRPEQQPLLESILGENWDVDKNRQQALQVAQIETQNNPQSAFAWFNVGSNLVYFERYVEAAQAYDKAREIGLPMRMLRYQFGPFMAYFHAGRNDDLLALTEYALKVTANSEETLLWQGWGLYRQGKTLEALENFQKALEARPGYGDAQYAIQFVQNNG